MHWDQFVNLRSNAKNTLFICCGVCFAATGLKCFLLPNNFLDGGAMGVSLLLHQESGIDLALLIVLVNLPFVLFGYRLFSWMFALKSILAILSLAILVHSIEFPVVTFDKLLIAVFGGFFLGSGIGLVIRGGCVIDGTEVLALAVSRKTSLTVGDFIGLFNIGLFGISAWIINIETAMYSMLTYLAASKTIDFVVNGIEEYIGVMIVSEDPEVIKNSISENLGRGFTVFKSEGGHGKKGTFLQDSKVIFCVVTRLEVSKLLTEIEKVDPSAFVIQYPIKDTRGGMIKKRPFHD